MDCCDITNSKQFMEALIHFLNEASICTREVRQRTGANDGSPVQMNEEEKVDKLGTILCNLNQNYQMEKRKTGTANQTQSAFAMDRAHCGPKDSGNQELIERKRRIQEFKKRPRSAGGQKPFHGPGIMRKAPELLMAEYCGPGQEIGYEPGMMSRNSPDQGASYGPVGREYCPPGQNIYEPGIMGNKTYSLGQQDPKMCHESGMAGQQTPVGRGFGAKPQVTRSFIEDCSPECQNVVRSGGKTW
ncbi:unnamed protein product [Ceutorhynchus assimilis]|uniref:Uncharacterized protein n=1 Tax=Ceutorhynchus assimilis TaxID=467358 RepID=A0A9N9QJQ7_9CUCU|nr:unnamed protein product [Ceutorhynchus assimilis]